MIFQVFLSDRPGKLIENINKSAMTVRSFTALALLILAGFLGNYFTIPLFFGADFLFGSMAVLLVLYFYGLGWGMFAAVMTHSYTYLLWGHPYGFLNFTCEALFVGIFLKRGRGNLLGLVGLFWLLVGMPMAWIEHGLVMHMGTVSTAFIMLKQAINGVFNAMLVSLAICYLPLGRFFQRLQLPSKITLRESLFNLLVMMVLLPALLLTMLESKREKERLETGAVSELHSLSANVQFHLRSWYQLHLQGVQELAVLAGQTAMAPSTQLQHDTEILNHTFPDFRTMHVENAEGRSIAFDPQTNERGEPTLGLDFSGRAWFQEVKAKQQPLVSEVFVGHLAIFSPIVNLCVPVFRENHWLGCATGTLDLKRVQEMLRPYRSDKGAILTLTDPQGRIIASTAPERTPMQLWDRKKTGVLQPRDALMYLWQPDDKKLPSMSRWKESFYVQETLMEPELPWKLTAEVPVAPLQSVLYTIYVKNLAVMACLTTLALLLSLLVSGSLTRPLTKLAQVTANLPEKLSGAESLDWPASSAREVDSLISNFKSMTKALDVNFYKLQVQSDELMQANRGLAEEVLERQQAEEALRESEGYLKTILGSIQTGVIVIDAETHEIVDVNKVALELIGISKEKLVGASCNKFICPREKGQCPITDLGQVIDNSERILLDGHGEKVPIIKSVVPVVLHGRKCLLESFIDISERKRTEETLESLRRENELILNSAGEGILGLDLAGRHTFVNPAAGRMLGYKVEELVGHRSHSIWHHTKADGTPYPAEECQILSSYKDGIIRSVADEVFWRKDGTSFPAEYHSTPIIEKGNLVGAVVIFTDITERRRVEEALQKSEERFRELYDHAPLGYHEYDAEGRLTNVNHTDLEMLGYTVEEMIGQPIWKFNVGGDIVREQVMAKLAGALPPGKELERTYRRKDGTTLPCLIKDRLIRDEKGRITGIRCTIQDISERKKAEEEIKYTLSLLNATLESTTDGVLVVDRDGKIERCNRKFGQMWRIPESIIASRGDSQALAFVLDQLMDPERFLAKVKELYNEPLAESYDVFEFKDGRIFERYSQPQRIGDVIVGRVWSFRDITERKRIEEERQRLEERLRRAEKMEAMGTLAGGVAHDLNNVLGVLVGYSELLLMEIPEENPLRSHVSNILQSGHRAAAIIQDLLTLARRGVAVSEVVNLNDVISDCFKTPEFEKLKAYHPQVSFKNHLDQDLMNVKGSPIHLSKTIMNLLFNATEAISDHGEVTILVENRYLDKPIRGYDDIREGDYVVLRVSDNGKGISCKDIGKIFEPFYTKKVMGRSGTGLGLAVVWGTVKDHGGYIDVQSEEGKGSTFMLYFPVTREERAKGQPSISPESYQGRGESILVVDDVKEQRELAATLLSRLGYRVNAVSSGEEAVTYIKTNRVDLLVLDMIMDPGMDGLETYQRALEINPKHRAVIVSGFSETDRVKKAQDLGAGAYVRKPYILEKIGLAVRRELDRDIKSSTLFNISTIGNP